MLPVMISCHLASVHLIVSLHFLLCHMLLKSVSMKQEWLLALHLQKFKINAVTYGV